MFIHSFSWYNKHVTNNLRHMYKQIYKICIQTILPIYLHMKNDSFLWSLNNYHSPPLKRTLLIQYSWLKQIYNIHTWYQTQLRLQL